MIREVDIGVTGRSAMRDRLMSTVPRAPPARSTPPDGIAHSLNRSPLAAGQHVARNGIGSRGDQADSHQTHQMSHRFADS